MNDSESKTLNFQNNFENNNIDKVFDLKNSNISNLTNIFNNNSGKKLPKNIGNL